MPPKPQPPRRESSAPPDSVTPKPDALPGDLRREDQTAIAPDSLPGSEDEIAEDEPQGAHALAPDGGAERELILSEPEVHRAGGRPHVVNI